MGMIHVGEQVVHGKTSRSKRSPVNAGFAAPEEGCHSGRLLRRPAVPAWESMPSICQI